MVKIAVVQQPPKLLDKKGTIDIVISHIEKASKEKAKLVVFSESFIPGYPAWMWRLRPGSDIGLTKEIHKLLFDNSINLEDNDLKLVCDAAKKHKINVFCGINEKNNKNSTLYNTNVVINDSGEIVNKHRKLMPTNPERMVWGFGDGSGLKVVETSIGKIGGLICWENFMPLARYTLYSQGIQIYIAPTYDSGDSWVGTLQHIAKEGCCYVIGCGCVLETKDIPESFPQKETLYPKEDWINPGDSVVIAPGGDIVEGPLRKEKGILYVDLDLDKVDIAKRTFDVSGHYSRPDVFTLNVNMKKQDSINLNK